MQDHFAGDVGDYFKLSLLRSLAPTRAGVIWYRAPGGDQSAGGHISYLFEEKRWRHFDPDLFDALKKMVLSGSRSIAGLETILGDRFSFIGTVMPNSRGRQAWFSDVLTAIAKFPLIFADPDNGFASDKWSGRGEKSLRSISFDEVKALVGNWRSALVYHHHARFTGGHDAEIQHIAHKLLNGKIASILVFRVRARSPRSFFLLNGNRHHYQAGYDFRDRWNSLGCEPALELIRFGPDPRNDPFPETSPYSHDAERREERFVDELYSGKYPNLFDPSKDATP